MDLKANGTIESASNSPMESEPSCYSREVLLDLQFAVLQQIPAEQRLVVETALKEIRLSALETIASKRTTEWLLTASGLAEHPQMLSDFEHVAKLAALANGQFDCFKLVSRAAQVLHLKGRSLNAEDLERASKISLSKLATDVVRLISEPTDQAILTLALDHTYRTVEQLVAGDPHIERVALNWMLCATGATQSAEKLTMSQLRSLIGQIATNETYTAALIDRANEVLAADPSRPKT